MLLVITASQCHQPKEIGIDVFGAKIIPSSQKNYPVGVRSSMNLDWAQLSFANPVRDMDWALTGVTDV